MSTADWLIVAAVVLSIIQAASQGFFAEAFALGGTILGFLVAAWEYPLVSNWFAKFLKQQWAADIAGFLILFLAISILAGLVGRIASRGMREAGLRWMDRILGAAFGVLRGLLWVTVFVLAVTAFYPGSRMLARSEIAPYLLAVGRAAAWLTPVDIRHRVSDGIDLLQRIKHEAMQGSGPNAAGTTGTAAGEKK
ncbi:MAG TPA: CvpA family protein [Terriglobales bacterium]|nr:CvpA family protein [Terriglobales bacterium]